MGAYGSDADAFDGSSLSTWDDGSHEGSSSNENGR